VRNVPGPPENEILSGPYNYYVRSCYDYNTAATCGAYTDALVVNCPTPVPLRSLDATCTYPFGPIELTWAQSAVPPPVAETNRHIAKYAGAWNYRYVSLSGSALSYDDSPNITPGVQYGYNIKRCYTEYGTGDGDCRYLSGYANQDNVTCNIRARCDTMSLGLPSEGCWIDGALTRCVRGSTVSGTASGYNGTLSTPPFDTTTHWGKTSVVRVLYPTPSRVADNEGSDTVSYAIPADATIQLETDIEFNTNMRWTGSTVYDPATNSQVNPICVRGDIWGPSAPVVGAECDNSCTAQIRVSCNVAVWSNWTDCAVNSNTSYTNCTRTRTNECLIPETEECPGLFPDPGRTFCMGPTYTPTPTYTLTPTPTATNTPVPGATNTPTPTITPISATNTPIPPTLTHTPTLTPIPPTPTEPPGQPSFEGEVFYDFNQNGTMDQSCASGAIYEWLGSTNFGGTGNDCADKSALTALEALIGPIPDSLNGFQLLAEGLGGTSFVYGENPKFRLNGAQRFYYFAVQNSNNYRLTVTDPNSSIRNCIVTSTNPRTVYVGAASTTDINVGVYCNPMPTHTPTLIPTLPINTSTPTPTHTPTAAPLPELVITGSFNQQTGAYIRSAPGQFSNNNLPVENQVRVQDFVNPGNCADPRCSNLSGGREGLGVPTEFYAGYRCAIQFPAGCPLVIPQLFVHIAGSSASSYYSYYGNGSGTFAIPGSSPPTSYTAPVVFTYQTSEGWLKVIGGDVIRANRIGTLTNNIPFITDRFNAVNGGTIYVTGDVKDLGHATFLDVFQTGNVGGVVAGDIDTMPADTMSEYGGSVSSYSLGSSTLENQQQLATLVQKILTSKPISNLGSFGDLDTPLQLTLLPDLIYTNNYGDGVVSIENISINSNSQNILIITDTNGNLSDVTFSNDIDPTEASSLVVIAKNVYLSTNVGFANAVFITSEKFFTGAGGKPLKIKGNVVALGGIEQQRSRFDGDHARPTFLIQIDPKTYFNTLKLLNVSTLEYRIVQ
jgi:hypothetical protein